MRLGNKLALVLALAGTVTIIISEILATCVSVGLLAAGNAGSNCTRSFVDESDVEVVHVVPSMLFPVSINLSNFTINTLSSQRLESDSRYRLLSLLHELVEVCQRFAGRNEYPWSP